MSGNVCVFFYFTLNQGGPLVWDVGRGALIYIEI